MMEEEFDPERIVDAMAPFLGLPVDDAYRSGIITHLTIARQIARDVLGFETGDEIEPAPVFRA